MMDPADTARVRGAPHARGSAAQFSVWLVLAAVLAAWLLTLDARHLLRSDEGRYAEIAREMFASGDWVTIRYNGLKYFEKPPLHLWLTALAYHAFGVGEWQARLWVALCGAGGVLVTALAAQRWAGRRAGVLTALVLLATPSWNIASHFNSLDMSVSGALACVLAALLIAQHPQTASASRRRWMWAAWAAMGAAVLTKGLIGIVLPGLALVLYTPLARDWVLWRRLHLISGAAVFLAVTAPWFVLVSLRNPEFAQFFFIHEHWQRYTSGVHQRGAPAWYFVPQLLGGFLPWLFLAPRMWTLVREDARGSGFRPLLFCAVWAAAIFAFFSASGSKLPGYIVPMFPALALLAGLALDRLDAAAWRRQLTWMAAVAVLALATSPLVGRVPGGDGQADLRSYGLWLSAACALAVAGVSTALWLNGRGRLGPSIAAAALAWFGATTVGLVGHETLGRSSSGADLVPAMNAVLTPEMPVYSVRLLDHTLPFYLRRHTVMVEQPDELEFGTQQEPQKWLPTLAAYTQAWTTGPRALAVMSPATFAELQTAKLPMFQVARDQRRMVVANFALPVP